MTAEPNDAAAGSIEGRAALLLRLRRSGVRDLAILRAIETVPRELFAPYRFRDLANRNMALPIGCGQTMPSPADLARRLEALGVKPEHRVLEVGTGSAYATAALARLAREVVSIERFETLAIEAGRRLSSLAVSNAIVLHGDGLAPSRSLGLFDRIIVHASVSGTPRLLADMLAPGGVMIFGRLAPPQPDEPRRERLARLRREGEGTFAEQDMGPCRLGPAVGGAASAL